MGAMHKFGVYLGLVEDEERYPDDDHRDEIREERPVREMRVQEPMQQRHVAVAEHRAAVQRVASSTAVAVDPYRITTLHPRTYNEAKLIGEEFRQGVPVIMNLTEMDDVDAKRLVDFSAGLVFGCHGTIERVTQKVFLLSPADVHVTAEDKARIAGGGFYNQS
jgi:cell division inhibitor SepF